MSGELPINEILKDYADPPQEKPLTKRRSANIMQGEIGGPPAKRGGSPVQDHARENIDPLGLQIPRDDQSDDSRDSSRQSSPRYEPEDGGDGNPYSPELAAMAQDVLETLNNTEKLTEKVTGALEKVEKLTDNVQSYSDAVTNAWKPLNTNLKAIQDGVALRNATDQVLTESYLRQLAQLTNDLKDAKEKPPAINHPDQLKAMEQQLGAFDTQLTLINGNLNNVLNFLNGMAASQRMAQPDMGIQAYGHPAYRQYPRPPTASASEAVKYCILCAERSNGTHITAECTRYKHFADRTARAIANQICLRCLEHYEDKDGKHRHHMCPQEKIACSPCVKTFGDTVSTSHNELFCPLAKHDTEKKQPKEKKHPKERQPNPKKGNKDHGKPYGYLNGAFNS